MELGTNIPDVFKFSIIKGCTELTYVLRSGLADRIKHIPRPLLHMQLHLEELNPQLAAH